MNVKLNVIYPRRYRTPDGQEAVHWMHVGIGWMNDKGIDMKLWVMPPADQEGNIRMILREPTRDEQERAAAYERRTGQRPPQVQQRRPMQPQRMAPPQQPEPSPHEPPQEEDDQLPF